MIKYIKKALLFFVAGVLILSCGCTEKDTTSTPSNETEKDEITTLTQEDNMFNNLEFNEGSVGVSAKTLHNTLYKLKNEGKLTVGYFGGSVTVGQGASKGTNSWRYKVHNWLKSEYPNAEINEIMAAVGGSGAEYGTFRVNNELLSGNPDLVFIEFCINDSYEGNTKEQSGYFMESVVNSIYEHNPYADIVMVFITDMGKKGENTKWIEAHKEIADHYGIPYIDAGAHLKDLVGDTGSWEDYFIDWAHPSDNGHAGYADAIMRDMKTLLSIATPKWEKHEIPDTKYKNLIVDAKLLEITEDNIVSNDGWTIRTKEQTGERTGQAFSIKAGSEIVVEFEGSVLGLYMQIKKENVCSEMEFIVDEKYSATTSCISSSDGHRIDMLFDSLDSGKHTLRIVNKSGKRGTILHLMVGDTKK